MARSLRRTPIGAVLTVAVAAAVATLCACAPEADTGAASPTPSPTATATASASTGPEIATFPTGTSTSTTPLPTDCRDLLPADVLAALEGQPYNAPGMGGGLRADSSRVCVWGEPGAAGTYLLTVIGYSPHREAMDALFALGAEGYTCYEPAGGVRCESTWDHPTLPGVTQGRTVFWRDGVVADTQYSNLAPAGYTSAIIEALWPAGGRPPSSAPSPTSP
jgi:hypothetical protein